MSWRHYIINSAWESTYIHKPSPKLLVFPRVPGPLCAQLTFASLSCSSHLLNNCLAFLWARCLKIPWLVLFLVPEENNHVAYYFKLLHHLWALIFIFLTGSPSFFTLCPITTFPLLQDLFQPCRGTCLLQFFSHLSVIWSFVQSSFTVPCEEMYTEPRQAPFFTDHEVVQMIWEPEILDSVTVP